MENLLNDLVKKWSESQDYKDVKAFEWNPGMQREERCPERCELQIHEERSGWDRITDHDAYRQTRICRKHGYARIYVISGPTAMANNWTPNDENDL